MVNLDPSQERAIKEAVNGPGRLQIITGSAGTGKTTVIYHICNAFLRRCLVLAPTGKAAARLREVCDVPAMTVHRALLYDGETFRRTEPFREPVIIDEASMLDSALFAKLLDYHPPRVILVGDAGQLPPVGNGQPFHDLVATGRAIELTVNYRATAAVHEAATAIRSGRVPPADLASGNEVWRMTDTGGAEETVKHLASRIKSGEYDPEKDVVLSPKYGAEENDGGINALNSAIRAIVNPPVANIPFCVGDRLLCCKNFGADDLWNGDTGTVVDLKGDDLPVVKLDRDPGNPRDLNVEQVRECRLGYAMSVHKAQGSQFRRVWFICLLSHLHMLSRPLIYTAVTRAREQCVVLGQLRAFALGVRKIESRKTVMQHLLGVPTVEPVDVGI